MEGYLKKQVEAQKLFVKTQFPTLYYMIDFGAGKIYIKKKRETPN